MTYLEALNYGFPDVQVSSAGIGALYEDLTWEAGSAMPSKEALDAWISANPNYGNLGSIITVLALRNRFLPAEKAMIDIASIDVPTADMQARGMAAALRVMMQDITVATYIDLHDQAIIGGIQTLEYFGLIGVGRADEILSTPVNANERPDHITVS